MTALAVIVGTGVNNDSSADNGVRADERELRVGDADLSDTRAIGLEVAQVTYVPLVSVRGTVVLAGRVEVRTGRSATVGVVTELVDVEASLSVGVHVLDLTGDSDGTAGRFLGEGDDTLNGRVTLENGYGL